MTHLRIPGEQGDATNYERVFTLAPEVYQHWGALSQSVKAGMDLRRYELVTLVAARRIGATYCSLAHAGVLRSRFYDDDALRAIATDWHDAGLDPVDVAVMDFADVVARDPGAVTAADTEALRAHGLSEQDIFHVVLAVSIRRFFGGVLQATGAEPDQNLVDALPAELVHLLA
ncbi:peroxidase [Dactylosporangium sp. NPDC005555]|uniref:carboxymuconolactone decarboxylase family protein n=1 Tax=Dactylosporangium sp. NPDC005555 TaxID=3154889 RepID=UPI0033AC1568